MSLSTTSAGPPVAARTLSAAVGSNTSPCSIVAPGMGATSSLSRPITRQPRAVATCAQLPGAAQIDHGAPGLSTPKRRSISRSLKAARAR